MYIFFLLAVVVQTLSHVTDFTPRVSIVETEAVNAVFSFVVIFWSWASKSIHDGGRMDDGHIVREEQFLRFPSRVT